MGKYLGIPFMVGKDRTRDFREIKEKMIAKVKMWCSKTLSQGGKQVFIKSILQAIPTYLMSYFLLPKVLCQELDSIIKDYWWKHNKRNQGIHWMKWQKMCTPKNLGGMGFRDMAKFNIAMLCKQGWRLIKHKDTLMYQVLQAKYFPGKSFMESKQGHNSSFTWQSIWATKKTLEKGLRWRVGNGQNIRIWKDPWIKGLDNFKPVQRGRELEEDATVSQLMDNSRNRWNMQKITTSFPENEACKILEIPLGGSENEDVLVWNNEDNGRYSVRSCYKLLTGYYDEENASQAERESKLLKKIWAAKIPSKIQITAWRITHNFLPVFANLFKRRICSHTLCPMCGSLEETTIHAVRQCKVALEVWLYAQMDDKWSLTDDTDIFQWLLRVTENMDRKTFELGLIILWALWSNRNATVMQEKTRTSQGVAMFAASYFQEYKNATTREEKQEKKEKPSWHHPPQNVIKVNFDGSVNVDGRKGGIGVIARDENGEVMGALQTFIAGITDPSFVEAHAAFQAIQFAYHMGFMNVILEGDALTVINQINQSVSSLSEIGNIIEDVKKMMRKFRECTVKYVRREANEAAHSLAKKACLDVQEICWVEDYPSWLNSIIIRECNSLSV